MGLTSRYCHDCGQDQPFGQPHEAICPDTPDGDCPEWVCTGCGAALITGFWSWPQARRQLPPGRVA
jgi:hypothetical protein